MFIDSGSTWCQLVTDGLRWHKLNTGWSTPRRHHGLLCHVGHHASHGTGFRLPGFTAAEPITGFSGECFGAWGDNERNEKHAENQDGGFDES